MNRGIVAAAYLVRAQLIKQAGVGDVLVRAGEAVQTGGRAVTGAHRAWNRGAEATGRSVAEQLAASGVRGHKARLGGKLTSGALKAAPIVGLGYLGYKAFQPEVESAKQRLGQALRARIELFRARRQAAMPYYYEGRFQ